MQLGDRALDDPARHTQTAAVTGTSLADLQTDPVLPQETPVMLTVVAAIRLNTHRSLQRAATLITDRRHSIEQRYQLRRIVSIGGRLNDIQWRAVAVDDEVTLAPPLSRSVWLGAV